jgi:hypothetical protein
MDEGLLAGAFGQRLKAVEDRLDDLFKWCARHEDRHNTEDERLNDMLRLMTDHDHNHHSLRTHVTRTAPVATVFAGLLVAIAELIQRLLL